MGPSSNRFPIRPEQGRSRRDDAIRGSRQKRQRMKGLFRRYLRRELVQEADFKYPIIVCADGRVMDGMHRVAKAKLQGQLTVKAVKFEVTPKPDFINVDANDLEYDD